MADTETSGSFNLNDRFQANEYWYHTHPTVGLSVNWKCSRASAQTKETKWTGSVTVTDRPAYNSYGYIMAIKIKVNGGSFVTFNDNGTSTETLTIFSSSRKRGTWSFTCTTDIEASSCDLEVYGSCSGPSHGDSCDWNSSGSRYDTKNVSVPAYNPSTPATNASNGKIFSTNNTSDEASGRNILDKPDLEVWWTWTGATAGTPDSVNGIKQYNIYISNTNNVNNASSITETQNYTKNKHISLFTLCRSYNVKVGGTLYCWVNTQIKSGAWLRKSIFRFNYNEKRWFYKI